MTLVKTEFGEAYQAEMAALLARRFRVLCVAWAALLALHFLLDWPVLWGDWMRLVGHLAAHLIQLIVVLLFWQNAQRSGIRPRDLLRLSFWLVVINAVIASTIFHAVQDQGVGLIRIGLGFLMACILLPWTPRQALQTAAAVWLAWILAQLLLSNERLGFSLLTADAIAAVELLPGVVICWLRTTRLGRRIESASLRRDYEQFHRELFDARRLHEAIFPPPRLAGPIRFAYHDAPRLGIGGDLLAAHEAPDGSLSLVLLDVAGDGIAAALTVHRLHGEIERLFAENPRYRPRDLIAALDRYAHLMLAPHGVYATAFALRFDHLGSVSACGAGHAPVFIRRQDGSLEQIESTTWPLGSSDSLCDECEETLALIGAGEVLIAHSDGAYEWRDRYGRRLGPDGVQAIIRTTRVDDPLQWPAAFMRQLQRFRGAFGEPQHDVLVAAVCMGVDAPQRSRSWLTRTATAAGVASRTASVGAPA